MWALAVCLPESEAFFSKLAAKLANIPLRELGKDTLIRVLEVSDFALETACPWRLHAHRLTEPEMYDTLCLGYQWSPSTVSNSARTPDWPCMSCFPLPAHCFGVTAAK